MHKVQDKPAVASNVLKFFAWGLTKGTQAATELDYVPMPESVVKQIEQLWTMQIKDGSGKTIAAK
jgi:phosphate transport system substrate-binding protein